MDWLIGHLPEPPLEPPADDDDPMTDIGDIPLDYFWAKCEHFLPEDWELQLMAYPDAQYPGRKLYAMRARLMTWDPEYGPPPQVMTTPRHKLKRVLEDMFYSLRDML